MITGRIGVTQLKAKNMPRSLATTGNQKRQGRILLWRLFREHGPADTLILGFQFPRMSENELLLFEDTSLWQFVVAALAN